VGTWNVLSLHRSGALRNLIQVTQAYKTDFLAIQEIRWLGRSITEKKHCTIYYSCDDKQHVFGTCFIVSKRIRSRVIYFKPVDKRICVLRIRGKFKNFSFICSHAPTEEKSEREKGQCYERLERTYKQCPSYDIKIILGDMNAKAEKEIWMGIDAGARGLHDESDDRGTR
jgi:exonuclease III